MRRSLVFGLRSRGVDVLTAVEADMINRSDQDHLKAASAAARTLDTYNVGDYCALHQAWIDGGQSHAGIVVAPQQRDSFGEELRCLLRLIAGVTAEEMRNRIEFLSSWV